MTYLNTLTEENNKNDRIMRDRDSNEYFMWHFLGEVNPMHYIHVKYNMQDVLLLVIL